MPADWAAWAIVGEFSRAAIARLRLRPCPVRAVMGLHRPSGPGLAGARRRSLRSCARRLPGSPACRVKRCHLSTADVDEGRGELERRSSGARVISAAMMAVPLPEKGS